MSVELSNDELLERLREPFDPSVVKWFLGSTTQKKDRGMALAYADRFAYSDRLDTVVGPLNWSDEYVHYEGVTICKLAIRFCDEWITKSDGAGKTQVEGEKGAVTDSFKRACSKFGVGRCLYDLDAPWVAIESAGQKGYRIAKSEYTRLGYIVTRAFGGQKKRQANGSRPDDNGNGPVNERQAEAERVLKEAEEKHSLGNGAQVTRHDPGKTIVVVPEVRDAAPEEERQVDESSHTYPEIYEECCDIAQYGKGEVTTWLKTKGNFPSLNAVPQNIMREMYRNFVESEVNS